MEFMKKTYSQWSDAEKRTFGREVMTYAKEAGLPLRKKKRVVSQKK